MKCDCEMKKHAGPKEKGTAAKRVYHRAYIPEFINLCCDIFTLCLFYDIFDFCKSTKYLLNQGLQ